MSSKFSIFQKQLLRIFRWLCIIFNVWIPFFFISLNWQIVIRSLLTLISYAPLIWINEPKYYYVLMAKFFSRICCSVLRVKTFIVNDEALFISWWRSAIKEVMLSSLCKKTQLNSMYGLVFCLVDNDCWLLLRLTHRIFFPSVGDYPCMHHLKESVLFSVRKLFPFFHMEVSK